MEVINSRRGRRKDEFDDRGRSGNYWVVQRKHLPGTRSRGLPGSKAVDLGRQHTHARKPSPSRHSLQLGKHALKRQTGQYGQGGRGPTSTGYSKPGAMATGV